ncbi:hypothetical protein QVD17_30890 [Tagetes erecta]|uniref:Leucine-rich repeat-containing N-terminal plant-type domain-containing protein n=1 Tax=Tagetes erecta TaxID=13708 RepID=A0AAD8K2D4_TARER|nr:hypothetical protein QVD17_30890 [Tagetes erecta]
MEISFLVLFTLLFFQRFGTSTDIMITTSSNVTCIENERHSLLIFKKSLTNTHNVLSTWKGVECCKWQGIGCHSRTGHVVKLDLRALVSLETLMLDDSFGLQGKLSNSLENLKHLRYLDLSMNEFSGNIPKFLGSFKRLEYLNLSGSGFDGVVPQNLGNLSRLQYLDLRNTFLLDKTYEDHKTFSGYFDFSEVVIVDDLGWLSTLSSLRHLDLSGVTIGEHIDWFHQVNMLPSLLTLNLACSGINIPPIKYVNFTSLNSLDLSRNGIHSTIPIWISNLTSIMHLNLQFNQFHGQIPSFFGTLNALDSINLSFNSFNTSIPELLCNLSSLLHLDLSENMFFGPIPASLGLLLRLEDLYLNDNKLGGNIPMSLGQLSKFKNLDLSYNSLVDILFETHFSKLKNLRHLVLSSSSLALNFSSGWLPPFQLQNFFASSCSVGPHFPSWLQTQTNLQKLDLFNSSIMDTLPQWFDNILSYILELDISDNQIHGKLPRFHDDINSQRKYRILKMNSNKFEGLLSTIPSNVSWLDLSNNLLSGHIPQTHGRMNPSLEVVNLSKNRFNGSIPIHLCEVTNMQVLDLSHNMFSGRLPRCLGNLIHLNVIDLAYNTITGVLPRSLGSLKDLISLHLQNNRFQGDISLSLQNLTNLVTMDLGNNLFMGVIPFWIGKRLSNLKTLNLQSNKFTGNIPLQICQLNALQYLSLANNSITGTIPRCLGNLSGMIITASDYYSTSNYEESILVTMKGRQLLYTKTIAFPTSLDLSSNNIVGEIPNTLMNLVGLTNLNLSCNLIKGNIPFTIGSLKHVESLDLSMNKLSGQIPQSLTSLNFLSYLNLSFNNLSGSIPVGNQIQTLDDKSIYKGNDRLCGPPVSRSCKKNDTSYNHVSEKEDQVDTMRLWFYVGMGPGFVVGFIGLLGSLHFIRNWRVAYFKTFENVYGWLTLLVVLNLARLRRSVLE